MVSIPLKSGHIVIIIELYAKLAMLFRQVSIPLKSGHIVIDYFLYYRVNTQKVSIPLKSGHIVIIGFSRADFDENSFNPLKIGSYCNHINNVWKRTVRPFTVSIPLKSGHIVIKFCNFYIC